MHWKRRNLFIRVRKPFAESSPEPRLPVPKPVIGKRNRVTGLTETSWLVSKMEMGNK